MPAKKVLNTTKPNLTCISLNKRSNETSIGLSLKIRKEKKITKEKIRRRIIDFVFILYLKLRNPFSISLASTYSITACPAVI